MTCHMALAPTCSCSTMYVVWSDCLRVTDTSSQFGRYGVNSQISTFAYDPVQSLLAVGTNESQFGPGVVYIFGQKRVCVTLRPPRRASIKEIQFCADKLVVLDNKNDITIFSLETRRQVANYAPPGHVTCILTDPSLDYCFTGLSNGAFNTSPL